MNFTLKPVVLAVLVATTQLTFATHAQTPKTPPAPVSQLTPTAAKTPVAAKAPEDWIIYDSATVTPVVDQVSRHLAAARSAFDAKDSKKAAAELRAVAAELKTQSDIAARMDKDRAKAEIKLAQDTARRMEAAVIKLNGAAGALEAGKIKTKAELDAAIDKATRADMERRWLVADVATWYPVSEEPQRHFAGAVAAYARKDYQAAATEIRQAASYLRLEAGRATGTARRELDSAVSQLDQIASVVENGAAKEERSMDRDFARANHALALAHRSEAIESWTRKEYDKAGYELKAAAYGLESAASWVGRKEKAEASAAVADGRALGDKLVSGASWTREEAARSFESLGDGINEVGRKIGGTRKASPFNAAA